MGSGLNFIVYARQVWATTKKNPSEPRGLHRGEKEGLASRVRGNDK